ncbi:MAG: dihydrofolate reductase [Rhodothermales bacterium]|jgi:dihydrofolate reductase
MRRARTINTAIGANFMRITIIAALARNRVIGRDNDLPWRISQDLKRFKALTTGHSIVMGRRTWDSIGFPLPKRHSIVLTRDAEFAAPGATVVHSLEDAIAAAPEGTNVFIIGGAEIYQLALAEATHLELTHVDADVDGDTYFPELDWADWREVSSEPGPDDAPLPFRFVSYKRG